MKLNFNFTVVGLDGLPLTTDNVPINLGRLLANLIMQYPAHAPGEFMMWHDWAHDLWKTGLIELSKSEQATFKRFIENYPNLALYIKMAALKTLEKKEKITETENGKE